MIFHRPKARMVAPAEKSSLDRNIIVVRDDECQDTVLIFLKIGKGPRLAKANDCSQFIHSMNLFSIMLRDSNHVSAQRLGTGNYDSQR
jgi:hypothetical protein